MRAASAPLVLYVEQAISEQTISVHSSMSSLADAADLVGFFSYSREDDEGSGGRLSKLRERIQEELRANSAGRREISGYGRTRLQLRTGSCGKRQSRRVSPNRIFHSDHYTYRCQKPLLQI